MCKFIHIYVSKIGKDSLALDALFLTSNDRKCVCAM